MKIAVGISGGVDSAVAALLLKRAGHEIYGVMMTLWNKEYAEHAKKNACYGPDEIHDIESARQVCQNLGISLHEIDCSRDYEEIVLSYFRDEYQAGRTPNPCIRCNQMVKFGLLPQMLVKMGLGFESFATGHYARVIHDETSGRYILKKAIDAKKDQSYFIYRLSQKQLSTVMFPLGELSKNDVRKIACDAGLAVHDKQESQDFYGGDLQDLLNFPADSGNITDTAGNVLGKHRGVWHYTIGQRKGLGISSSQPMYVVKIDKSKNIVVVGTESEALKKSFVVNNLSWCAIEKLSGQMAVMVKIRSSQAGAEACIKPLSPDTINVTFTEPQAAITPGQSAVFYLNDSVLGGGIIETVHDNDV